MSSRRYPTAELYEERERDFYRNGNRSDRNYDELDIELRRGSDPRRSAPDFFREDYNRPTAGPMVVRPPREDDFARGPRSHRGFDDDTRSVRSGRPPPPSSVRDFDPPARRGTTRDMETDETDITIRRREQSRPRQPEVRAVEREDIVFRRGDGPRAPPSREAEFEQEDVRFRGRGRGEIDIHASRSEVSRHGRDVSAERGSIRFQERDGNFDVRASRRDFSRDGRDTSRERSSLTIRGRERSLPPPSRSRGELVAREHEEFTIRRRDTSPQAREIIKDEIIIRRKEERIPTPSPSPPPVALPPPPPPPLEPEIRPPIIQEIITHHRHIDHGVERARSPTPPPMPAPPSPPPPRAVNETLEIDIRRRESHSRGPGRSREYEDLNLEIDINRESGAFNVKPRKKDKDMWTEVTKDLVIREAIDQMGYSCEETDDFFYVMEYLKYEDVLQLVELSDEIRRKRKVRIEFERTSVREPARPSSGYDEKFYEREVSYDTRRSNRYR